MQRQAIVEHIPGLRRYARALTGDAWAADDLVQDTLERACNKWLLWTMGTDLRAWLFTLMHNLHANQIRGAVRKAAVARRVDLDDVADELSAEPSGADMALDLQRCLMQLPEDQRAVLLLVSMEDMPYAQVASVLKIPLGTVMSRLSRARARLRLLMEGPAAAGDAGSSKVPPAMEPGPAGQRDMDVPASKAVAPAAPVLRRLK